MQPFIKKYEPIKSSEVKGQDKAVETIKEYVKNYSKHKKRALLVHGPPGVGKTSAIHAIANEMDM